METEPCFLFERFKKCPYLYLWPINLNIVYSGHIGTIPMMNNYSTLYKIVTKFINFLFVSLPFFFVLFYSSFYLFGFNVMIMSAVSNYKIPSQLPQFVITPIEK